VGRCSSDCRCWLSRVIDEANAAWAISRPQGVSCFPSKPESISSILPVRHPGEPSRGENTMRAKSWAVASILFFSLGISLAAQEITGTISGTVSDNSGGVVPEANVTVTSTRTGATRSTTTTGAGVFFFNSLPVGDYQLTVEKGGFEKYQLNAIHLHVNDKLSFPITLKVGGVSEQVVVFAETSQMQTESAEISNLVGTKQMLALPLNGRDFNQLVDLVPGVAPDNNTVGGGEGLFSDTAISVDGNQSNSNLWLIDGEYNQDSGGNGNLLVTPSVDAIEEFKILRNNYSAEFGGATGGIINVITKSGQQTFHGSVFEFLRNDAFDANNFFLNLNGQPKSELRLNNFGFTGGGPIWIPHKYNTDRRSDFFFYSFEESRQIQGNILTAIAPSARQRNGLLVPPCAEIQQPPKPPLIPCDNTLPVDPNESPVVNEPNLPGATPTTASPSIDPNSTAFMQRMPLPNAPISNGFNFLVSAPQGTFDHQNLVRWDHYFGSKHVLTMRFVDTVQTLTNINDQLFGLGDGFPSVSQDWHWLGTNVILKLTSTLSSRLINDFQFGYSNNNLRYATSASSDPVLASRSGFTFQQLFPETTGSFPTLNPVEQFSDSSNAVLLQNTEPFSNRTDNFQYKDDLSYTFGKHNMKMGAYFRFNRKREPANGGGNFTAGTFSFNTMSDFLLGNVATYSEEQTQNPVPDRERDYAVYFQDTWKILPKLTLDLGLRYQILAQIFSASNNISNFRASAFVPQPASCVTNFQATGLIDPAQGCILNDGLVTPGMPGITRSTLNDYYGDWEPRIGLAWQALPRLVVRSGFGIFGGRDALSQTSALGRQPPFDFVPVLSGTTYAGISALSPFDPATSAQPPLNLAALDQHYRTPTSYQYNLSTQYLITKKSTLEVDYIGSHQVHLGQNRNINQVPDANRLDVALGNVNPDTVRPFIGYSIINNNERVGSGSYNSLQVFFNQRVAHGIQFQAAYTWSKNLTDTINQDTEASTLPIQNAFDPRAERGVANQNQPQSLSMNFIWALPFFAHTSNSYLRNAFGGWQFVGITTFRSGLPANVCLSQDIAGTGDGQGVYECQRPDQVANPNLSRGKRTIGEYFNVNAYVLQPLGTFGDATRNGIVGPGVNNWNLSVFKDFSVPWFGRHQGWLGDENAVLQFRSEFFNAWNHTQFSGINTVFLTHTDAAGNLLPTPSTANGFGQVSGARDPREIQFALKLTF
jgi:outer membrane receptor protein involved in Fe transport